MYNPHLKTFLQVADAGSFSKAASQQYITAPALIKQINLLEKQLGVTLFIRNHRGLELTESGKVLYREAKEIIRYCEEATSRVRKTALQGKGVVRVGFSPLSPSDEFVRILPQLQQFYPRLQIQMVPFINSASNASGILRNMGQDIDVIMGVFDQTTLRLRQCAGTELWRIPLCCAVPLQHPLAKKDRLTMADLEHQNLMLIRQGWSQATDALRDEISRNPGINIVSFEVFSLEQFNRCVNENMLMVAVPLWNDVHPQFKCLEVDWPYSISYGLFHAPNPSVPVRQLISAITKIIV